jgi:hypothetical protein
MAKRTKTARTRQTRGIEERKLNLPGFSAEASLGLRAGNYRRGAVLGASASIGGGAVPQLGVQSLSGVDVGAYLRCRANGGGDLVCRFFGGLPPFTIGGLLF